MCWYVLGEALSSRACGSREIVCSANDQTCRHDDHTFSLYQMLHPFVLLFVPLSYLCHCLPWVVDLFLLLLVNIQSCFSIHAVFLLRQFSLHHAVFCCYIILVEIFFYFSLIYPVGCSVGWIGLLCSSLLLAHLFLLTFVFSVCCCLLQFHLGRVVPETLLWLSSTFRMRSFHR